MALAPIHLVQTSLAEDGHATEAFGTIYVVYIEDWWLFGCRGSVAEHWLVAQARGVLGSTPGSCWPFHFPLFLPQNVQIYSVPVVVRLKNGPKCSREVWPIYRSLTKEHPPLIWTFGPVFCIGSECCMLYLTVCVGRSGTGALSWLNAEKLEWAPILLFGRLVRCSPPMGVFHETMVTVKHCPRISKSKFPCHVHTTVFGPRYCLLGVKFVLPIPPYLYRLHALMLWRLWRMQTYWSLCYLTRYSCTYIYT